MIDLNHEYALLEDGTIEPLWYHSEDGTKEQRWCYKDEENGQYYLDHDRWFKFNGLSTVGRFHHRIIRTADTEEELREKKSEDYVADNDEE